MEDEREQTPNEVIIPGYRYRCLKCETWTPVRKTLEEAQDDQIEHRQDTHSGMEPIAGDPITEDEYAREPAPVPAEEDEPRKPAAERPVQTWEWLVLGFIVLVVLNFLFGK
ncbi:hypothetical protein ACFXKV_04415 [Streptomyces globisporus]|uniref:hypothetical protein n=1 Tax=Streptomyces globisporus TaxID=1908 RepID=UPI00363CC62E